MHTPERNMALIVSPREIDTPRAFEYLEKQFPHVSKAETSSIQTALGIIREYRDQIFMLVVMSLQEDDGKDVLQEGRNAKIPHVIELRDTMEIRLIGVQIVESDQKITEPFDSKLIQEIDQMKKKDLTRK